MSTPERIRIDSWKAIAAFLGRDERTVQRWEKERALPVYRIPGERGRVFAYTDELTGWLEHGVRNADLDSSALEQIASADSTLLFGVVDGTPEPSVLREPALRSRGPWRWVAVACVAAAAFVAGSLALRLHGSRTGTPTESTEPFGKGSSNAAAESAFLQGRFLWNQRKPVSLQQALESFRQAERLDPTFAAAFAGEAETYALMPEYAAIAAPDAFAHAKAAAQRAVALDPGSASAHRVLAFALLYGDWDVDAALPEFDRAVSLDPRSAQTHHWYANALMTVQRKDQAAVEMQKARELDPSSVVMLTDQVLLDRERGASLQECLQRLRDLSQAQPNFLLPQQYMATFLLDGVEMDAWASQTRRLAELAASPENLRLAQISLGLQTAKASPQTYLHTLCGLRTDPLVLRAIGTPRMAEVCLRADDPGASVDMWRQAYVEHDPNFLAFASKPAPAALAGYAEIVRLRATVKVGKSAGV